MLVLQFEDIGGLDNPVILTSLLKGEGHVRVAQARLIEAAHQRYLPPNKAPRGISQSHLPEGYVLVQIKVFHPHRNSPLCRFKPFGIDSSDIPRQYQFDEMATLVDLKNAFQSWRYKRRKNPIYVLWQDENILTLKGQPFWRLRPYDRTVAWPTPFTTEERRVVMTTGSGVMHRSSTGSGIMQPNY